MVLVCFIFSQHFCVISKACVMSKIGVIFVCFRLNGLHPYCRLDGRSLNTRNTFNAVGRIFGLFF